MRWSDVVRSGRLVLVLMFVVVGAGWVVAPVAGADVPVALPGLYQTGGSWPTASHPGALAVDGSGNVYVAEGTQVAKLDPSGTLLLAWTVPGASSVSGVAADRAGDVYVADNSNDRIDKFDSRGDLLAEFGSLGKGDGQFNSPEGVAVSGAGIVYVADMYNQRVQEFDSSGKFLGKWGVEGSGDGQFENPAGVGVDGAGDVYVLDQLGATGWTAGTGREQKFDASGNFLALFNQYEGLAGLAVDSRGNSYDINGTDGVIFKSDRNGVIVDQSATYEQFETNSGTTSWYVDGSWGTTLQGPAGVAVDGAGNVYVADGGNSRVVKFTPPPAAQWDSTPPTSSISCNGSGACSGGWSNTPVSVSLDATDDLGGSGVRSIVASTDGSDPTLDGFAAPGQGLIEWVYSGPFSVWSTTTVKYRAYDNAGNVGATQSQLIRVDLNPPSSTMSCSDGPCSGSHSGAVSVSLGASDGTGESASGAAAVYFTTDGSTPTQTPADLYTGAFQVGATTTVRYFAVDNAGNVEPVNSQTIDVVPPGVTLSSPVSGAQVSGQTSLSADVAGIDAARVDFFVSGPASSRYGPVGSVSAAPYTVAWDSSTVPDGSYTVVAAAFDASGVETDSTPVSITVANHPSDTTPPSSQISCNGGSCGAWYGGPVSVSLSASDDPGGSGVASIRYTTDGSDPSLSNGSVYSGAFSVDATSTVKYRAFDNAGNAEAVATQSLGIDAVPASSSISCNAVACSDSFYTGAVSVELSAADNQAGSGVASVRYTTDGSDPSRTNGNVYDGAFAVDATSTVKYRAYDNVGNAEAVNSAVIKVDGAAPSSSISCDGGSCGGWLEAGASVALAASDNPNGSGVESIRYTTDGSDPSQANGSDYSGPFSLSATTTVKYRAVDRAGNAEAVNTQIVQVDATAPVVSLSAPAGGVLSGSVSVSAAASDNVAVDHVEFLIDGRAVGRASSAPYSVAWDSRSVPDGSHTIVARAVDGAGNVTDSSPVSVTVANNNLLQNPSLESAANGIPSCWQLGGYGTNAYAWTYTGDAHTGSQAENLNITSYTSGDRKLITSQDTGTCAPAATPGHSYTLTAYYKVPTGTATPRFYLYYRTSAGWSYWTQSPKYASTSTWKLATWSTPALPAGATNISIGIGLENTGSVTVDDLGLYTTG